MKKYVMLVLFGVGFGTAAGQSFYLPVPPKWNVETMQIPIDFAPAIPYTGEEHLRFSPSWGDPKSEELWCYCFLWWIGGDSKVSKESLDKDIQSYYAGLVGRNIIKRKIDSRLVVPTRAKFSEATPEKGDVKTLSGTVDMLDYLSLRPITLHISVHVMPCAKEGKLAVFFEVSPQPRSHAIWKQFEMVREGFRCVK